MQTITENFEELESRFEKYLETKEDLIDISKMAINVLCELNDQQDEIKKKQEEIKNRELNNKIEIAPKTNEANNKNKVITEANQKKQILKENNPTPEKKSNLVPTGILASGFSEVMEEKKYGKQNSDKNYCQACGQEKKSE